MAMYVNEKQIFIFVADSDAIEKNKIKNSNNSSSQTTNYCPPETKEQNQKFYEILGPLEELSNKPVYLDAIRTKEYKNAMKSRIKSKFAGIYKGEMIDFEETCDKLISLGNGVVVSNNLFLTGERPYLNFSNSENWKLFKSILFGESSIIVIEKYKDGFKIFPLFRPLFLRPEELVWDGKNHKVKCGNDIVPNGDIQKFNGAFNKIYYGAPGCGKSYYVKHELLPELNIIDDENHVTRTTFYQDYSNTDFVGQILPKIENGDVTYEFTPGPFAIALKNAIYHPSEPVVLIIEEINRGNAASIFGDIFQLLDRNEDGRSEYEINHINLQKFIEDEISVSLSKIYIPSNLYIIATMNTSDQNVFTLDTAFKRRWKFEKIKNDFSKCDYSDSIVPGTDSVTWKQLVTAFNNYIVANADELMNEDKQIGVFFVDEKSLAKTDEESKDKTKIKDFAYKMLEYLWDDVAKFTDKSKWFSADIKTLDQLIENYIKYAESSDALKVFGQDLNGLIKKNN